MAVGSKGLAMTTDDNPYAPPQTASRPVVEDQPVDDDPALKGLAWRDGSYLLMGDNVDLSQSCARCGAPAHLRRRFEFFIDGRRRLWVGLCAEHSQRRKFSPWLTMILPLWIGGFFMWIGLALLVPVSFLVHAICLSLLLSTMFGLMVLSDDRSVIQFEGLVRRPEQRPLVRLGGFHPNVLDFLPDWPGTAQDSSEH